MKPRLQSNSSMLLFVTLFKDALISVMVRRLPTTPQTSNPGLASQSSSSSHRYRERGQLLLGGQFSQTPTLVQLSLSSSPSHMLSNIVIEYYIHTETCVRSPMTSSDAETDSKSIIIIIIIIIYYIDIYIRRSVIGGWRQDVQRSTRSVIGC